MNQARSQLPAPSSALHHYIDLALSCLRTFSLLFVALLATQSDFTWRNLQLGQRFTHVKPHWSCFTRS